MPGQTRTTARPPQVIEPGKLESLRIPFPPDQIGKLPKSTCRKCANSESKVCSEHTKAKCRICDNYLSTAHMHVDYVGHAQITDRLLAVDPEWDWQPLALDANGLPVYDKFGGLWIKLTVLGVTKLGYGESDKNGAEAVKIIIGDALRNAGMRFGMALELWAKGDLPMSMTEAEAAAPIPDTPAPEGPSGRHWVEEAKRCTTEDQVIALGHEAHALGELDPVKAALNKRRGELRAAAEA